MSGLERGAAGPVRGRCRAYRVEAAGERPSLSGETIEFEECELVALRVRTPGGSVAVDVCGERVVLEIDGEVDLVVQDRRRRVVWVEE